MRILTKKILRDIWHQKGRSISIILIITLAMGLYGGLLLGYDNASDSFTQTEEDLRLHSARFVSFYPVNPDDLDLDQFNSVQYSDSRVTQLSSFKVDSQVFTAPIHGIKVNTHPQVDDFELLDGRLIQNDHEILMEKNFLDKQELSIGDTLVLDVEGDNTELKIVGAVFSPEYIYKVNPKTGLPDLSGLAPIWASIDYVQSIFQFPGVNEILVRFNLDIHRDSNQVKTKMNQIKSYIEDEIGTSIVSYQHSEEADQQMKEGDLGALDDFARVFGGVVLLIALFAIYDSISKLIANQRNYIGTMRALGGSKRKVATHYASMASLLSIIGIVIGIPFAWLISDVLLKEYAAIIGIPVQTSSLYLEPIIEAVGIHLVLSISISIFTSIRAATVEPREAMSSAFISQIFDAKPVVERILEKLVGMKPTTAIPVRNVFRYKRKTLLTIFTFAMSIVLMVSALAFMDSFNAAVVTNYEDRQQYDLEVYFTHQLPESAVFDQLDGMDGIDTAESFISQLISVKTGNLNKSTSMYAFESKSSLRHFDIISGNSEGMVIGNLLAGELDVKAGDDLTFLNHTFQISGVADEIISEAVFLDVSFVQSEFDMGTNITGIIISLDNQDVREDVEDTLRENLPVSIIIASEDVKSSIQYLIQGLFAMVGAMVFIGFITVALFSFNTIVLEIISRENEFVNLKSLGSSKKKILKIILIQSLIVALTGGLLAIPLSYLITSRAIDAMMAGLMSIDTVINIETFVISIGSALLASATGIIAAFRYVNRIDLVDALRERVSN